MGRAGDPFADFSIVTSFLSGIAHFAILSYLLGSKDRSIITTDYREPITATPHVWGRWS